MMRPIRLLVSARDPAAAFHLSEVAKAALADTRFELSIVAQRPADGILASAKLPVQPVHAPYARTPDSPAAEELLRAARVILSTARPDAILCGLSSPAEGGIDEALLAERTVPAFLMQDFWGEQNSFFGRGADLFFVLDAEAARLSKLRHGRETAVVGSPRHAAYSRLAILENRETLRRRIGALADTVVIGFFGQSLHHKRGYGRTLDAWRLAMTRLDVPHLCFYRPHPREGIEGEMFARELSSLLPGHAVDLVGRTLEETLMACDVVCSPFSNCLYDAAYLNSFSPVPLLSPMALLFDLELADLLSSITDLNEIPYFKESIVMRVRSGDSLAHDIGHAIRPQTKHDLWTASRAFLPNPSEAPQKILNTIIDVCR